MDSNKNQNILDKIQNKKKIFEVFQGKFKLPPPLIIPPKEFTPSSKVVVFDLDETLGSFSDLYLLWTGIKHICPEFDDFSALLDLYPEFLRYNILYILQYLYEKKVEKKCDKIYIYTNNQCLSREWVSLIINYFNDKMKGNKDTTLFDQVISAFKIGNTNIELSRTTHEKTYNDLICCTMLPKNTEICFIDDTEFMKMKQDKVYYIHPKAYIHSLTVQQMIDRWVQSSVSNKMLNKQKCVLITSTTYWSNWFSLHKRNFVTNQIIDNETNMLVTRKIMLSIREFFILSTYYENKYYKLNYTRKYTSLSLHNTVRRSVPKKFFSDLEIPVNDNVEELPTQNIIVLEPVVLELEPVILELEPVVLEPVIEVVLEPEVETVVLEPVVEVVLEPEVETVVEPEVETVVEPVVEVVLEPEVETVVEPEVETVVEPEVETVVEPEVETVVEPEVETVVEPEEPAIIVVPEDETKNKKNKKKKNKK